MCYIFASIAASGKLRILPNLQEGGRVFQGSYQSGQMGLTVNQLRNASGVRIPHCPPDTGPCGAAVAHSLGKTGVMGSIPITGSCSSVSGSAWPGPDLLGECCDVLLCSCPTIKVTGCRTLRSPFTEEFTACCRLPKLFPLKLLFLQKGKFFSGRWLLHVQEPLFI